MFHYFLLVGFFTLTFTSLTSKRSPSSVLTVTTSPGFEVKIARPRGESEEILPLTGSASTVPTI